MTKAEYIDGVLLRMNEATQSGISSIIGSDTTQVSSFIEKTFTETWRSLIALLPSHYLPKKSIVTVSADFVPNVDSGTGYVLLPADFERLHSFKMKGWEVTLYTAFLNDSNVAQQQRNDVTRGSWIRPVLVIENMEKMYYYSLPKWYEEHKIDFAYYIPKAVLPANMNDNIAIGLGTVQGKFAEPLMWLNAALVFDIFGKPDYSKICRDNVLNN